MTWTDQATARLSDAGRGLSEARDALDAARRAVERTIKSNPLAALAVGLGAGVILGWLVKRR